MTKLLFKNNATSRLGIDTYASSITLTVLANEGSRFPQPGADEIFKVTIEDRRTGQIEICHCYDRTGDILNVIRAQEGTAAQDFLFGATVSHRMTAGTFMDLQDYVENATGYTQQEADDKFVDAAGDTMTGYLTLSGNPVSTFHAATKNYVDIGLGVKTDVGHQHPESDIVNLVADLAARPTEAPTTGGWFARGLATWQLLDWSTLPGKPTEFPVAPHTHPISDVNNLQTSLDTLSSGIVDLRNTKTDEAPIDGQQYARQDGQWHIVTGGAYVGSLPPGQALDNSFFWDCDNGGLYIRYNDGNSRQWVNCNAQGLGDAPNNGRSFVRNNAQWIEAAPGFPEAPNDGKAYSRKSMTWAQPAVADISGLNAALATYLPLAGGSISGQLNTYGPLVGYQTIYGNYNGSYASYGLYGRAGAGYGGVIGYSSNVALYCILGHNNTYSVYANARIWTSEDLRANGNVNVGGFLTGADSGSTTTTNGPSAWIGSNGSIYRSTSSLEVKGAVEPLEYEYAAKVLELEPIFYRSKCAMDNPNWSYFGFGAENNFATDFRFSTNERRPLTNDDGSYKRTEEIVMEPSPEDPEVMVERIIKGDVIYSDEIVPIHNDINAIVASLLLVVKKQQERIEALEAR